MLRSFRFQSVEGDSKDAEKILRDARHSLGILDGDCSSKKLKEHFGFVHTITFEAEHANSSLINQFFHKRQFVEVPVLEPVAV